MEKLQLKMKIMNIAVTEEMWEGFDSLKQFWQLKGIKDEAAIAGSTFSAGINSVLKDLAGLANQTPEMMKKMADIAKENRKDGYDPKTTHINDAFDITI